MAAVFKKTRWHYTKLCFSINVGLSRLPWSSELWVLVSSVCLTEAVVWEKTQLTDIWMYKIYSLSAVLIFFIVLDFFVILWFLCFPCCAIILTFLHRVLMINRCFVFGWRLVTHKHFFFIFKVLLKFGLSWLRRLRNSESLCPLGLSGLGSAVGLDKL